MAVLSAPGALAYAADAATALAAGPAGAEAKLSRRPFLETGYAYLPLVWGGTLAHYLRPFLSEAGLILQARFPHMKLHALPVFIVSGFGPCLYLCLQVLESLPSMACLL